jgi:predicted metal-binding protein
MNVIVKPVIDLSVRELCKRPYPGHSKGCPNYGRKKGCPPAAPVLMDEINIEKTIWAIVVDFNLEQHCADMKKKHPGWSRRQCECCLYWQSGVMAELKHQAASFCSMMLLYGQAKELNVLYCPEAFGVNITETMKNAGIELEWPPERIVRKIAFVGFPAGTV